MMNWNKYSLFRLPKSYKRFEYTPRYYDEKKEERKRKLDSMQVLSDKEETEPNRRLSFRESSARRHMGADYKSQSLRANFRLFVILLGVLLVSYILFREVYASNALEIFPK